MSPIDRLSRALVTSAARRWPADLADDLRAEWLAELSALPARRRLTFAASLALSPAVDEQPRTRTFGRAAAVAIGVTLLAGAAVNAAHLVGGPLLPALACAGMAALGARVRMPPTGTVLLLGAALFAFLFIGNDVALLPYMGIRDIAPGALVWTALMLVTVRASRRTGPVGSDPSATPFMGGRLTSAAATERHPLTKAGALAGGLSAVAAAVTAGNWQGVVALASGAPAPDLLPANVAASAGPMLLCTVFALAVALRGSDRPSVTPTSPALVASPVSPAAPAPWASVASAAAQASVPSARRRITAGVSAALGGLALAEVLRLATPQAMDNAAVFGFGFLAHPTGRAGLALLIALLAVRVLDARAAVR